MKVRAPFISLLHHNYSLSNAVCHVIWFALNEGLSWNVLVHGVESRPMLIVKRNFEDAVNYFG
ncbi:hypothetical protein ES288_D06G046900v1 [Gossypium darwinii]|uniref:EAL domain-containing protein n=1 Tax=Gossypium darwinii TaxID=34276 RepID=A0A5D2C5J7_GOSDA|nr:hypothetical protein ES288_D06G046900v1 [Gossypium darwinii]